MTLRSIPYVQLLRSVIICLEVTPLCSYSNSYIVTNRPLKCLLRTIFPWTYLDFHFSKILLYVYSESSSCMDM